MKPKKYVVRKVRNKPYWTVQTWNSATGAYFITNLVKTFEEALVIINKPTHKMGKLIYHPVL